MEKNQMKISIVIPVNNEEENIKPLYSELKETLNKLTDNYEIIFIDDYSKDSTSSEIRLLKEKKPLVIFPQGRRSTNFDEFKSGVGFLQKKAKVPVIVAHVYGTDKILPKGEKKIHKGRIKVIYAKVKDLKDTDSRDEIAAKVINTIKNL